MIRDLSLTLQGILQRGVPNTPEFEELRNAQIVFDRPTEQFKPTRTSISLFLYDVRENVELRSNDSTITRQNGRAMITPSPLRVVCSYLVTAWPTGPLGDEFFLQEHRLLSQVLQVFASYPEVGPLDQFAPNVPILQGRLRNQEPPIPIVTAHADTLRNLSEFWTALGNQLRPSISVTATVGTQIFSPQDVALAGSSEIRLEQASAAEIRLAQLGAEELGAILYQIGGRVLDSSTPPKPIAGASVGLIERGMTATTNLDGQYSFGLLPSGTYTLRTEFEQTTRQTQILIPNQEDPTYRTQQRDYTIQLNVQLPD